MKVLETASVIRADLDMQNNTADSWREQSIYPAISMIPMMRLLPEVVASDCGSGPSSARPQDLLCRDALRLSQAKIHLVEAEQVNPSNDESSETQPDTAQNFADRVPKPHGPHNIFPD
jgi:hypothetical protein